MVVRQGGYFSPSLPKEKSAWNCKKRGRAEKNKGLTGLN
jgi:hypothetical protein